MTEKQLANFIGTLNSRTVIKGVYKCALTETVDFATVWFNINTDNRKPLLGPYSFYLVKNEHGKYVSTVFDMTTDLHWFTVRRFRNKGYLSNALKKAIIPHLFNSREKQQITIDEKMLSDDNFGMSVYLAKTLGFKKIGKGDRGLIFELCNSVYTNSDNIYYHASGMTESRMIEIQKKFIKLSNEINFIRAEVEMELGDMEYSDELKELVKTVGDQQYQLLSAWNNI